MGRYLAECKGAVPPAGEISVVGVKTRARDILAVVASADSPSSPGKKIKKAAMTKPHDVHELRSRRRVALTADGNSASYISRRMEASSSLSAASVEENCSSGEISSDFPTSCTSSNDASSSGEDFKDRLEIVADPEVESALTSSSKNSDRRSSARREKKVKALKSDDLDSPPRHPGAKSTLPIKMPSDSEIEEFFASAEKDIQKRFTEKYNFDIVKDVPLEGRFEWLPVKP